MSGAWAREADAVLLLHIERDDATRATRAAYWLTQALVCTAPGARRAASRIASAIIRRERKALDAVAPRLPDFASPYSDERLVWIALQLVAEIGAYHLTPKQRAYRLREAEAALRTLHKRGRA